MENVKCNLCDTEDTKLVYRVYCRPHGKKRPFNLVKCNGCGLVYLNPRPDEREIESFRYFLHDLGIYPLRQKKTGNKKSGTPVEASGVLWGYPLHRMEHMVLYPFSRVMDRLGLGTNLLAVARK